MTSFIKYFTVVYIAVSVFTFLFATRVNAETVWTVRVDVSAKNEKPKYSFSSNPVGAPNCSGNNPDPKPSAEDLYICPGDTVQWEFVTNGKRGSLTVYHRDSFLKKNGVATQWFHASEGQSDGGTSDKSDKGEHEYCVAIFDKHVFSGDHLYAHDPKVIIGKAPPIEILNKLRSDCTKLAIAFGDEAAEEKKKANKICADAVSDLEKLFTSKSVRNEY